MIKTLIIGKRSYLSQNLVKNIKDSKVFSVREILNLKFKIFKYNKINIIYNHAYPLSKMNVCKDYGKLLNENVIILNKLFNFFLKNKIKINKFIFSSSSAINGLNNDLNNFDIFDNNRKLYGVSKLLTEIFLISQKKNFNFDLIIARIFNIYGLGENVSLISKIISLKKKNKKIINFTNQNSFRDFIHISDVVKIYKIFLKKKNFSGHFNIGSGKAINIRNLINKYFQKKQQIRHKNKNFYEIKFSRANLKKLKKITGNLKFVDVNKFIKINLK